MNITGTKASGIHNFTGFFYINVPSNR
jgi:hypothetical protein